MKLNQPSLSYRNQLTVRKGRGLVRIYSGRKYLFLCKCNEFCSRCKSGPRLFSPGLEVCKYISNLLQSSTLWQGSMMSDIIITNASSLSFLLFNQKHLKISFEVGGTILYLQIIVCLASLSGLFACFRLAGFVYNCLVFAYIMPTFSYISHSGIEIKLENIIHVLSHFGDMDWMCILLLSFFTKLSFCSAPISVCYCLLSCFCVEVISWKWKITNKLAIVK